MQLITRINDIRTSPRKIRIVADSIRNLSLQEALDALSVIDKRGAHHLEKAFKSAVSNAVNNSNLRRENLMIKTIDINEGTALKRFHPSTRGRVHPYKKRGSSIRIVLEEKSEIRSDKSETSLKENNDKKQINEKEVSK